MTLHPDASPQVWTLLGAQADFLGELGPGTDAEATARTVAALAHLLAVGRAALEDLKTALHDQLPAKETLVIDGIGAFTRSWTSDSTRWDNDAAIRWVLDSRPPADPETGEIRDESPVEKLLACYTFPPSKGPSVTALRARGITDDFLDELRTREGKRPTVKIESA